MSRPIKLFIVEGENREKRIVKEMTQCFFQGRYEAKILCLPATQNIYMLYQVLNRDNFETDIVEVLRDTVDIAKEALDGISRQRIDEVYLFFDYDIHHNNTPNVDVTESSEDIVTTLLEVFNNETENGKLYISYPMVEAVYDYRDMACEAFSSCFIQLNKASDYKRISGENNPKASIHMDISSWKTIINTFFLRVKCLFSRDYLTYQDYQNLISPINIFREETRLLHEKDLIFVLSAFPEFLLDYFKIDFWNTMTPLKNYRFERCMKLE